MLIETQVRGQVDEHAAELAETRFACLWSFPVFPISSRWVTLGGIGHPMRLHGRSVLAGYLRTWGPILVIGCLAAGLDGTLAPIVAAAAISAATVVSWRWRRLRGEAARRRGDVHALAFGTRCDPAYLPAELRARAERDLEARWAARHPDRNPGDVASRGARSVGEAVEAYGLLRLAELRRGARGDGDAERLLASIAGSRGRRSEAPRHPYRSAAADAAREAGASLEALVYRGSEARADLFALVPPFDDSLPGPSVIPALLLMAVFGLSYVAAQHATSLLSPTVLDSSDLTAVWHPTDRRVHARCDRLDVASQVERSRDGRVSRLALCHVAGRVLPVELGDAAPPARDDVVGHIVGVAYTPERIERRFGGEVPAESDAEPILDAYMDVASGRSDRQWGILLVVAWPIVAMIWFASASRRTVI